MASRPNPFNKFINLLVLVVLAYAVISTYFGKENIFTASPQNNSLYAPAQKPVQSSFQQWSQAFGVMANAMQPTLRTVSETKGSGPAVACGQDVTYQYTDKVLGAEEAFVKNKRVSVRLGRDPIITGHLRMLSDMNMGGVKLAQFPSDWGYKETGPEVARGRDIESEIKLINATPVTPALSMQYRLFYKTPHLVTQQTLDCGASIKVKLKLWSADSKQLYPADGKEPEWMRVTIGAGKVPLGIETVLQNLSPGEVATAILPFELTEFFNPEATPDGVDNAEEKALCCFDFPKKQPIIVDIETAEAIEAASSPNPAGEAAPAVKQEPEKPKADEGKKTP